MRWKESLQWALLITIGVVSGVGAGLLFLAIGIILCVTGHYIWVIIEVIAFIFLIALLRCDFDQ